MPLKIISSPFITIPLVFRKSLTLTSLLPAYFPSMTMPSSKAKLLSITPAFLLVLLLVIIPAFAVVDNPKFPEQCGSESRGACHDKAKSMRLKIIALFAILVASVIGVSLPIYTRQIPAFHPDSKLFMLVKAFASGVILATGYMHVLPDSFEDLENECLPEEPWHKFPFTTFFAMLAAVSTLMVDSFSMSYYKRHLANAREGSGQVMINGNKELESQIGNGNGNGHCHVGGHGHGHGHGFAANEEATEYSKSSQLVKHRVVAQVLELGIVVHSVVIGLSMGASDNPCTIQPLIAALCFHQMFEGMGLGGCISQAEYGGKMKAIMIFFFSFTTPFGIVLGIGLSNVYSEDSPTALIVVGILNAISAGLLNYMALVDLLAADFMGPKLQASRKLQGWSYIAVLMGAGLMSLMAKWA